MKRTFLAALCAFAAACGGDDAADPASAKFDYEAATPVTAGSDAAWAVEAGEGAFTDALLVGAETDPEIAQGRAGTIMSLPDSMAAEVMDGFGGVGVLASSGSEPLAPLNALTGRFGSPIGDAISTRFGERPAVLDACVTVTPGEIRYSNCTETSTVTGEDGTYTVTVTMNGTFTFVISGGNTALDWDIDVAVEESGSGTTYRVTNAYAGSIDIGPATIDGRARSDLAAKISMTGYPSVDFKVTHLVDYDLDYEEPFCLTGGTMELRRVWTDRPTGVTSGDLPDEGVLFTFGPTCGTATVAWGTR